MLVIIFNFILGVIYLMLTKFADVCAWAYPCVRICDCDYDCVCIGNQDDDDNKSSQNAQQSKGKQPTLAISILIPQ